VKTVRQQKAGKNPAVGIDKKEIVRQTAALLAEHFPLRVRMMEPLKNYTTYKVGGPATAVCHPESRAELQEMLKFCYQQQAEVYILGSGSNILVHDQGVDMLVFRLNQCCSELSHTDDLVQVGAGVLVSDLVKYCEQHNLAGLDFMAGIPGTVGGALRMNAGAFVGEIGDRVILIEAITYEGEYLTIKGDRAGFGYRQAKHLRDKILLGCQLRMLGGSREELEKARKGYLAQRAAKQPLDYGSCGSVFKRPPGQFAGTLIEKAGCKGMQIGGAMVSPKHANFIINYENASAQEIFELIQKVQQMVFQKFNIWLELEVKLAGFSNEEENKVTQPN
jgi:UDP-N-acetylmuramate dehydrogenase